MRPSIAYAAFGTFILLLAALFLFPAFACACGSAPASTCLSNVKNQSLGLIMYANDCDDRFPQRDVWIDRIQPYIKGKDKFHDPEVPKGAYGYAFNGVLSQAKAPEYAPEVPLVYDSVNPIRNASDLVTSLPTPGRHLNREKVGRNAIAYADGHAKTVLDQRTP